MATIHDTPATSPKSASEASSTSHHGQGGGPDCKNPQNAAPQIAAATMARIADLEQARCVLADASDMVLVCIAAVPLFGSVLPAVFALAQNHSDAAAIPWASTLLAVSTVSFATSKFMLWRSRRRWARLASDYHTTTEES